MTLFVRCFGIALALGAASALHAAEPLEIGSRLEPLVDDYLISQMSGDVHQQLHQPTPREVVLVTGEPWEGNTSAYFTIFQDDDLYRMVYRGSHSGKDNGNAEHPEFTCYAESTDGIHWTKPDLGIVEFNGSKHNNIILQGLGSHCFVAFKDTSPNCPTESKYKGISRGRPAGEKGLYVFKSADGIHWSLIADKPVITDGAFDSQNLAFWDSFTKHYVDYHRSFINGKRSIVMSRSIDYLNWTEPVPLEYFGSPEQELYTNAIRLYPRADHIRIGFPTRYLPNEGSRVEPLFMSSRDGVHFHRWDEAVIPGSAPKDRMGNRSNYMANALVSLPDNDREYSVYATEAYYEGPDSRLRRFTYRVDGFVSVRAGEEGGELLTKTLTFTGESLKLNFLTQDGGQIRVRVESPEGEPLAQSRELTGDELAHSVEWLEGADLQSLQGRTVRLRFSMKKADLYSIQFGPAP
ncbi:MAG: hypothetical protein R3C09_01505 [Pirellulaceae bacterium]